jgi:hypothetical protein
MRSWLRSYCRVVESGCGNVVLCQVTSNVDDDDTSSRGCVEV